MTLRAKAKLVAMLLASPLIAAPPVWASSGGPSPGAGTSSSPPTDSAPGGNAGTSGGASTSGSGGASTATQNGDLVATASGDGITVTTVVSALLGRHLAFTGTTGAQHTGATVLLQRSDSRAGWVTVASGAVAAGGAFSIMWRTNYAGRLTMRTVFEQGASASQTGQPAPTLEVTVYRPAIATFYGKGFFGKKTACGQTLRRATLGVASRTLKCGTPVHIFYGGRTIVVPVIDRGPFANHARWDLTQATAAALGITGTETIGAVAG